MFRLWIFSSLLQLWSLEATISERAILGGKNAPVYPFYVQLINVLSENEGIHNCGGSLIALDTVLTAAHCVQNGTLLEPADVKSLQVVDAPFNFQGWTHFARRYHIKSIVMHENFYVGRTEVKNDIAIIKLNGTVERSATTDIIRLCSRKRLK